jgi:hypothetical protein
MLKSGQCWSQATAGVRPKAESDQMGSQLKQEPRTNGAPSSNHAGIGMTHQI